MLQKLRDKSSGWLATIILGLLTIPFAFVGIEQYMVQQGQTNVATIEAPPTWWASAPSWWPVSVFWRREQVSQDEFRSRFEQVRQQRRAQEGDAFDSRAFETPESKREVLDSLIDQTVQGLASQRAGIRVSDSLVRSTIQEIPAFQVDGTFNAERYRLALASQIPAQTPSEFDQLVRDGLQQSLATSAVANSNFITDAQMQRLVKLMGERRDVTLVMLPATADDTTPVTDEQAKAWYDAHQADYRAPESVRIEYIDVDGASMPPPAAADETALRERYEQEKSRFMEQEERMASHILVRVDEGAGEAAQQAAKTKAQTLAERARKPGADFAELARENSDDTGSKADGGDLGWVGKDMMVGPFEDALFAMQANQISDPVKTDFGWHVIKLREVKSGQQEPFEQVREALATEQAEADRDRQFNDVLGKLVDQVYKNPSSLGPAARELGLKVQKAGPFSRDAKGPVVGNAAVKSAAFSDILIQDGTVSDPIELGTGHSVLIRVTAHEPERARPMSAVREQVVAAIHADRARQAADKRAQSLLARLEKGETLQALAEAEGLPAPQEANDVPRGAPLPEPAVSDAVFAVSPPAKGKTRPGKAVLADGRLVLFAVSAVTPGKLSDLPDAQRNQIRDQLALAAGADDVAALISATRKRMRVSVNEESL